MVKGIRTIAGFFLLCFILSVGNQVNAANQAGDARLDQASARSTQLPPPPLAAAEEADGGYVSALAFSPYEPLLLLLLGSMLFSLGTLINIRLSKRVRAKHAQAATTRR